jgi:leader peptidase (prepilin peptidase)/N-methyltransferase
MALLIGAFGSLIGSFLNVVVYRVPAGKSIVSPPSACGNCGHHIRGHDNIPVLSWLILRGKCRDCSSPISARYPLVEVGAAIFFAVVAWRFLPSLSAHSSGLDVAAVVVTLVAFLYFAAVSVALALIDLDTRTLPNVIVIPSFVVGALLLSGASMLSGDLGSLVIATVGAIALAALYLGVALVHPGGMGFGDVKLAAVVGLFLGFIGWEALAVGTLAAFILGGMFGITLLATGRATRKTGMPFGPWMLGGAWIGILVGTPIASGYLALFGLGGS